MARSETMLKEKYGKSDDVNFWTYICGNKNM